MYFSMPTLEKLQGNTTFSYDDNYKKIHGQIPLKVLQGHFEHAPEISFQHDLVVSVKLIDEVL